VCLAAYQRIQCFSPCATQLSSACNTANILQLLTPSNPLGSHTSLCSRHSTTMATSAAAAGGSPIAATGQLSEAEAEVSMALFCDWWQHTFPAQHPWVMQSVVMPVTGQVRDSSRSVCGFWGGRGGAVCMEPLTVQNGALSTVSAAWCTVHSCAGGTRASRLGAHHCLHGNPT
jgi:hypothetical protein